jgi:hypothetical protein
MDEFSQAFAAPEASAEAKRRWPAQRRRIADLKPEDRRVQLVGLAAVGKINAITLDDGTGKIAVNFEDPALARNAATWKVVRVFGRPMAGELKGEIVQDMRKLNIDLYRKVMV